MDDPTTRAARTDAVRALEAEFSALFTQYRRVIAEQSERVSPGMLPGAYKVFTTIVRSDEITLSVLAERLLMDKGQLSRTVRELEQLGLVHRARPQRRALQPAVAHRRRACAARGGPHHRRQSAAGSARAVAGRRHPLVHALHPRPRRGRAPALTGARISRRCRTARLFAVR